MNAGPDFTKGADHLTLESLTSFLSKNPKGADMSEMLALMEQVDVKFRETPYRTVLSSLMMAQLRPIFDKILTVSNELGDKYGPMIMGDVKIGRVDRIKLLSYQCALNCFRLRWAQKSGDVFDTLRAHILKEHHADVKNPDDDYLYVPARSVASMEIWTIVDELAAHGGVLIYETIKVMQTGEPTDTVTIIQLCGIS